MGPTAGPVGWTAELGVSEPSGGFDSQTLNKRSLAQATNKTQPLLSLPRSREVNSEVNG